jgi:hypothetical protein
MSCIERTIPFEEVDATEGRHPLRDRLFRRPKADEYIVLTEEAAATAKSLDAAVRLALTPALPKGVRIDDMDGHAVRITDVTKKGRVYLTLGLVIE